MLDLFSRLKRKHGKHRTHHNTKASWVEAKHNLSKRKTQIMDVIVLEGAGTDRQIMARMGMTEPNMVRPSITALVQMGLLTEIGNTKCSITSKRVRLVDVPKVCRVVKH